MGVRGWNKLLSEEGWMPSSKQGGSPSLWMDLGNVHHLSENLVEIPNGAELHFDGFCLCFHIHSVAYARYQEKILASRCSPTQIRRLLPSFLPLDLVTEVTKEFLQVLKAFKIIIYWDGNLRYAPLSGSEEAVSFKHKAELKRQERRSEEWDTLQQYCLYGKVPSSTETWEEKFPLNRLFITQVMHTISSQTLATKTRFCEEEADATIASAVYGEANAYIVGLDSDFCFFPEVNYVPITSMIKRTKKTLEAVVIRRDTLAESLALPNDASMIDLAILLGNDYIDPCMAGSMSLPEEIATQAKKQTTSLSRTNALLDFCCSNGGTITSDDPQVQASLTFVRKLFNLQDMSEYPMEETVSSEDTHFIPPIDETGIDLRNVALEEGESVADAVARCLNVLMNHPATPFFTASHFNAFQILANMDQASRPTLDVDKDPMWRPAWKDVPSVYWIERITSKLIQNTLRRGMATSTGLEAPSAMFDPYLFHTMLAMARSARPDAGGIQSREIAPVIEEHGTNRTPTSITSPGEDEGLVTVAPEPVHLKLPVDEFQAAILESVRKQRVTIIQGETGCGKSSRIPVMLLKAPPLNPHHKITKLFISQPRRIAAKALVDRLRRVEPELRDQIALRMGQGVREYENSKTRAWFVTSGYLVRLLANYPNRFDSISYIIVDEVHERSVDTDILCLLCRRLLATNPHIKLVLMSATLAASLYQSYFGVPESPIMVGARRFPVKEVYLEDIKEEVTLPSGLAKKASSLSGDCARLKAKRAPSGNHLEKLYTLAANLATTVGEPGGSVLVFVSGMNDIVAIIEQVESTQVSGKLFKCIPVHSDIPFEDQMDVFAAASHDTVKIIVATNACESSVTLPDCDHVICLGLCKQILYNEASHRPMLASAWISRASATQRAGRTGRVRPGKVYRLYDKATFQVHMAEYEPGEILRTPLDSVILMLKEILSENDLVSEVLQSCLEPPNISNIDRSFESLYRANFITAPNDYCELTTLGAFVSALGIDLSLGSLVGLGIQMGVGAEAIQMAAILAFPRAPWIMSNPLLHGADDYNDKTRKTFVSRCHFDANLFSEPLGIMNLLWEYEQLSSKERRKWCQFHGIFPPRIKRLASAAENLMKRVAKFAGIHHDLLKVKTPPKDMPHGMITILRVIQVWAFNEMLIALNPTKQQEKVTAGGIRIALHQKSDQIEEDCLDQILMKDRHQYKLERSSEIHQGGTFEYYPTREDATFAGDDFIRKLRSYLISYSMEKGLDAAWMMFRDVLVVCIRSNSAAETLFVKCIEDCNQTIASSWQVTCTQRGTRRGIGQRACGLWNSHECTHADDADAEMGVMWKEFNTNGMSAKQRKAIQKKLKKLGNLVTRSASGQVISFQFPWDVDELEPNEAMKFELSCYGSSAIAEIDLRDMLGPSVEVTATKTILGQQQVFFPHCPNSPRPYSRTNRLDSNQGLSSWSRPLFDCIPEAARLVQVVASSGWQLGIRLQLKGTGGEEVEIFLDKGGNNARCRGWKRCFGFNGAVMTEANCVPSSATPSSAKGMMYGVCSNVLEIEGGKVRAEGLTLLPQGDEFVMLSRYSFGLFPEDETIEAIAENAVSQINASIDGEGRALLASRFTRAVGFHRSAMELGESLECFPEKVVELLAIFDSVDNFESKPWESLASNPFLAQNLRKHREDCGSIEGIMFSTRRSHLAADQKKQIDSDDAKDEPSTDLPRPSTRGATMCPAKLRPPTHNLAQRPNHPSTLEDPAQDRQAPPLQGPVEDSLPTASEVERLERSLDKTSDSDQDVPRQPMIARSDQHQLGDLLTEELNERELWPCKLMEDVVRQVRVQMPTQNIGSRPPQELWLSNWRLHTIERNCKKWFKTVFSASDLPYRGKHICSPNASWKKQQDPMKTRPTKIAEALPCVPNAGSSDRSVAVRDDGLYFDSLQLAVKMEACFWLERNFATKKCHWHEKNYSAVWMSNQLTKACTKRAAAEKELGQSLLSNAEREELLQLFESQPCAEEDCVCKQMAGIIRDVRSQQGRSQVDALQEILSDWRIHSVDVGSKLWFKAIFYAQDLPYLNGKWSPNCGWKKQHDPAKARPKTGQEATACIPRGMAALDGVSDRMLVRKDEGVLFESLQLAVHMEACFWLERQFGSKKHHWYKRKDLSKEAMVELLVKECQKQSKGGRGHAITSNYVDCAPQSAVRIQDQSSHSAEEVTGESSNDGDAEVDEACPSERNFESLSSEDEDELGWRQAEELEKLLERHEAEREALRERQEEERDALTGRQDGERRAFRERKRGKDARRRG